MANIITCFRILCSIMLVFFPISSVQFLITYMLCGLTDVMDGIVARKTNTVSDFGAKLDTGADFMIATFSAIQEGYYIKEGREIV